MTNEKERDEFERYSVEVLKFRIDDKGDPYVKGQNARDWKIWQACAAKKDAEIAELLKAERERCAKVCELAMHSAGTTPADCLSAIRALD